jgi:hypothetical protein
MRHIRCNLGVSWRFVWLKLHLFLVFLRFEFGIKIVIPYTVLSSLVLYLVSGLIGCWCHLQHAHHSDRERFAYRESWGLENKNAVFKQEASTEQAVKIAKSSLLRDDWPFSHARNFQLGSEPESNNARTR